METTLFKNKEKKDLQKVAKTLREMADRLESGEITLKAEAEKVTLKIPQEVTLEIKAEEEIKKEATEKKLEIEIEWEEKTEEKIEEVTQSVKETETQ